MRTKTITLALLAMVGYAMHVQAAGNRWYTSLSVGGSFVHDADISEIGPVSLPLQFTIAPGQSLQDAWADPANAQFVELASYLAVEDIGDVAALLEAMGQPVPSLTSPVPDEAVGTYSADSKVKFDPGVRFDAAVGYQLTEAWAFELQSGLLYNSMVEQEVTVATPLGSITATSPMDGNFYQVPILANVIYTFQFDSKWKPYLGAGLGGVASFVEVGDSSESAFAFAYQAMAGVAYQVSENIDIGVVYKFMGTLEQEFDSVSLDPLMSHSILGSFAIRF